MTKYKTDTIATIRILTILLTLLLSIALSAVAQEKRPAKWNGKLKDGRIITEEDLRKILENHMIWLVTSGKEGLKADLSEAHLMHANLSGANLWYVNMSKAELKAADLSGAMLGHADLSGADLLYANLGKANLSYINLSEADLYNADISKANLYGANLSKANLEHANLSNAQLQDTDLSNAILNDVNLSEAYLDRSNLGNVIFEPQSGTLPPILSIARAKNLSALKYRFSPHAIVELRNTFKQAGLSVQEREVTYAIKHSERLLLWGKGNAQQQSKLLNIASGIGIQKQEIPHVANHSEKLLLQNDENTWWQRIWWKMESFFQLIMFELTCKYGLAPGRTFIILVLLTFIFSFPYMIALKMQQRRDTGKDGIWIVWSPDRVRKDLGKEEPALLNARGFHILWWSFYFSLLSAFHIGWRELNVGNWIARIQRREYTLKATGLVRTISGIQSLISVYLLALWVLSYFGRPFE